VPGQLLDDVRADAAIEQRPDEPVPQVVCRRALREPEEQLA
jgi:hypothetical protein